MIQFDMRRTIMNIITTEDVNYLAQQSSGRINMILSGMTALMNDTDNKIVTMESQGWFQRMVKTITGKNKLSQLEIQQNHDKLNAYMSEAIAELYNRNCIDHEVMMSLGIQLNELYADHLQLKQMLGAFVSKLNEKIDSVDNFHMLTTEIGQCMYSVYSPLVAICKVISQFDNRILEDTRKLDIIRRSLVSQNIINNEEILLTDYLMTIVDVPLEEIGQIYLELGTIRGNFMSNIILGMMEKYHFLPDMARKIKNKKKLIDEVISQENLEGSITLSISEIYDDFVNSKIDIKNGLIPIAEVQIDSKLEEAEKLYLECKLNDAFELFKTLAEKGSARAMYFMGEYYVQPYGDVVKDDEEGRKWRQKGYELGDVLSSLNVAYSLPKDSAEREKIFNRMFEPILRLAEGGDVFAQNELADLYFWGYGVEVDEEKYIYWLKKSAEYGFWRSMDKLGDSYKYKNDYSESVKWYRQAAELGYASAQNNIADMLWYGNGVSENENEANIWYEKAAKQGYAAAQYNLGISYFIGQSLPQDYQKAIYWIKQSAEKEYSDAENKLALCYDNGTGVDVDKYEAFNWYKRAAEHGLAVGQNNLAICYQLGDGTEKNIEKAKEWYRKAANNDNDAAVTQLGIFAQDEGDYIEAVKCYRKAAENGYADAQNRLGVRYDNGQGVVENKTEAFKWYMKAAEQGHMKAQANVGKCYHYGNGVNADDDEAKEWLRKSSEQGWETADKFLRDFYEEGSGDVSNSKTIKEDTFESIKMCCELFAIFHDESNFDASYKLKQTLDIEYCDEIYLAYDNTLFKNGKNGFAITSYGIHCKELFGSYTHYTSFSELTYASDIYWRDSSVYADNNVLAHYTGSNADKDDLVDLFKNIKLLIRVDLL